MTNNLTAVKMNNALTKQPFYATTNSNNTDFVTWGGSSVNMWGGSLQNIPSSVKYQTTTTNNTGQIVGMAPYFTGIWTTTDCSTLNNDSWNYFVNFFRVRELTWDNGL
jgi:hypothetical protein